MEILDKLQEIKKRYNDDCCYKCGDKIKYVKYDTTCNTNTPYCYKCDRFDPNDDYYLLEHIFELIK